MDPFIIHTLRLMIFSSFGFPMLCGAVGEFAVNIAYGKPATQSSTYIGNKENDDTPGYPYNASLAVDGNIDTNFMSDGCSHTDVNSNSVWWEVDLMDLYSVLNITIYQRSDGNINWLSGFVTKGKLSNDSFVIIDNPKSNMAGKITIPVNTNLKFKGIRIELTKDTNERAVICLCEVEVLAEINVAEKKLAKQSSIYNETSTSFSASLAVDGNINTNFAQKSCSHTNPGDHNPWWSVDLQAVYFIIGIRIYQRMDAVMDRLKGFTLVGVHTDGLIETIQTPQPYQTGEIIVRVEPPRMLIEIRVHLNHSDAMEGPIITLCEVQVFAGTMCPKPPPFPRKGLYKFIPGNEGNWSYNFSLIIHCIEGYIIDGPISVRCVDINRWNGTFGFCSDIDECKMPDSACHNHGRCTNTDGGFSCECASGYTGFTCETDIDECWQEEICQYHGQCSNTYGSFACNCSAGYKGITCENALHEMNADQEQSKTYLLGWIITGLLCLILLVTNIVTCLRLRRHESFKRKKRNNIPDDVTTAHNANTRDHRAQAKVNEGISAYEFVEGNARDHRAQEKVNEGISAYEFVEDSYMEARKNQSNESENNAMEPYDNLQLESRSKSEYDKLTVERESSLKTT